MTDNCLTGCDGAGLLVYLLLAVRVGVCRARPWTPVKRGIDMLRMKRRSARPHLSLPGNRSVRGSSAVEMLIVTAILVIIASIFALASHHLIIRARHTKSIEDHRAIMNVISTYQSDHQRFPTEQDGLQALVYPRDYISTLPSDPFGETGSRVSYEYYENVPTKNGIVPFVLVSVGPDQKSDLKAYMERYHTLSDPVTAMSRASDRPTTDPALLRSLTTDLLNITYDPTNGLNSPGDIITFSK
ncbi:type II secretion system protein GspG [Candidatus Sumerlaeota bacterium]